MFVRGWGLQCCLPGAGSLVIIGIGFGLGRFSIGTSRELWKKIIGV